ncbi:MAG: FHA domain-containing protein [Tepidisphaeraceae bacterium]
MASLVIQFGDLIQAASFSKRVLIGRKAFNGVQFGQRVVSRIHAWIDKEGESFYIADAHSRGGTFVNGQRIEAKTTLRDGDEIKIGPAKMKFHDSGALPEGSVTFEIAEDGTNPEFENPGILLACSCGAPMWVPASMAGAYGRCAICHGEITVPGDPASGIRRPLTPNDSIVDMAAITQPVELGSSARPFDPLAADMPEPRPQSAARVCGICQSQILSGEATTSCPDCSQSYHTECWRENRGCAAYGCAQVGALDEPIAADSSSPAAADPEDLAAAAATAPARPAEPAREAFPWDFALLGGSVFGSVLGAFTFGVPPLAVGAASAVYAMRSRNGGNRIAAVSAVICVFGVAFGVVISRFVWFNVPLWGGR